MRTILHFSGLLLLNTIALIIGACALGALLFDAVPLGLCIGLFALPILIVQPWLIALLFAFDVGAGTSMLMCTSSSILLGSIVSYFIYSKLHAHGKLNWLKKFTTKKILIRACVAYGALIGVMGLGAVAQHFDFPAHRVTQEELDYAFNVPGLNPTQSHHLKSDVFFSSSDHWHLKLNQEQLDLLVKKLELKSCDTNDISENFYKESAYWWTPPKGANLRAYTTPDFPQTTGTFLAGRIRLIWNPQTGDAYLEAVSDMD